MKIAINMAGEVMEVHKPDCIGRYYTLFVQGMDRSVVATCIDATPEGTPKRMRIQRSLARGGDVLMPREYEILEEDTAWED